MVSVWEFLKGDRDTFDTGGQFKVTLTKSQPQHAITGTAATTGYLYVNLHWSTRNAERPSAGSALRRLFDPRILRPLDVSSSGTAPVGVDLDLACMYELADGTRGVVQPLGRLRSLTLEQLLEQLDAADARRACVFPLHDPERKPAYRLPNDRVLEWARESDGRLVLFCRLDPAEDALAECERCLAAGARGIKLHPRAQDFVFDGHEMDDVFRLAEEARVPVLIHAGRGLPPLADGLVSLALRHPGVVLILAHGAICDQGILTSRLAGHPGVLYDISCFFPIDVIELFARVPAERIVFASDPPYGLPATTLYMALRVARQAGLDAVATRAMLGATMAGLLDGNGLPPAAAPRRGPTIRLAGRLARVYGYASLVGPALFAGAIEQARAMLEMGVASCRDPEPGDERAALEAIGPALRAANAMLEHPEEGLRPALDLVYRANVRAATEIPDAT